MGKSFKSFDSTSIYYETMGDDYKKRAIIFIHGLGGDLTAWNKERKYLLERGFSSVAMDLRAHGLSDRPQKGEQYTLISFAKDVESLIEKELLKKPIIVGHCFGGMVALTLNGLYPHLSRAQVLVDAGYKQPYLSQLFMKNQTLHHLKNIIEKYLPKNHISGHRNFDIYKNSGDYNVKRIVSDIAHVSLKSYLEISDQLLDFDATSLLNKVKIPTLIIEGLEDSIIPPKMAEFLHLRIIKSELKLIKHANHILLTNNPIDVAKTIYNFIIKV